MNARTAWRWPLKSRGRLIALVLAVLALALITKTILDTGGVAPAAGPAEPTRAGHHRPTPHNPATGQAGRRFGTRTGARRAGDHAHPSHHLRWRPWLDTAGGPKARRGRRTYAGHPGRRRHEWARSGRGARDRSATGHGAPAPTVLERAALGACR